MSRNEWNRQVSTSLILASMAGLFCVGTMLAGDVRTPGFRGTAGKTSESPGSQDWPQLGGPDRNGIAPVSPKLMDAWPKDGPPQLWKSVWIPACEEGGFSSPIVADGKVYVYATAKNPLPGKKPYQIVTPEILADAGWLAGLPEELAKKIEAAWASKDRPVSGWAWYDPAQARKAGARDEFLTKKPELDKYIKDFIATLEPKDAKKYGDFIKKRLCIDRPVNRWGCPNGLNWEQLTKLSTMQDTAFTGKRIWEHELQKRGIDAGLFFNYPTPYGWNQIYTVSDTIVCLDAATGKTLWTKEFPFDLATVKDPNVQWWCFDSWGVSSTPAVSNGKLYVVCETGLRCFSAKDGKLLWEVKGEPEHASPIVTDGIVYYVGNAYDAETGALRWKHPLWDGRHRHNESEARYSSPQVFTSGGKQYLITTDYLETYNCNTVCLDLETGKHLWTAKSPPGGMICGDIIVAPPVYGSSGMIAYKMTPTGAERIWKQMVGGGGPIYKDHVYLAGNFYSCLDLKTGQCNWKKPVGGGVTECCASTLLADGKIFSTRGEAHQLTKNFGDLTYALTMVKATPEEYTELGIFNPRICMMTCPAFVNGKIFLRLLDGIACYDLQEHGIYLDNVAASRDALTFNFKQTGGGIIGDPGQVRVIAFCGSPLPETRANLSGDSIVVDIKDVSAPFAIAYAGTNELAGRNGAVVPAFAWKEARVLKLRKAFDNTIMLASDLWLQQDGRWSTPEAFAVAGAKITKVELDPRGKSVNLITDRIWKPGDAVNVTYASFPVTRGEPRQEILSAKVAVAQRAAARFLKNDETTTGAWKGIYGAEGAVIAGDSGTNNAPACATVTLTGKQDTTPWAFTPENPVAPQFASDEKRRSNRLWNAAELIDVGVDITDGKEHQLALFFPFGCGSLNVDVIDADTKAVLDTHSYADKGKEKYLLWNIRGPVILRVVCTKIDEGHSIWLGGVLLDPAAPTVK